MGDCTPAVDPFADVSRWTLPAQRNYWDALEGLVDELVEKASALVSADLIWFPPQAQAAVIPGGRPRFADDPLNPALAVPQQLYDSMCECPWDQYHSWSCPSCPIFAQLHTEDESAMEAWWLTEDPWPKWSRMRSVCLTPDEYDGRDVYAHHVLGEINGPTHWCPFRREIVTPQ